MDIMYQGLLSLRASGDARYVATQARATY